MTKGRKESEEIVVVDIIKGIIGLIDPEDWQIHHYRQWGIEKLSEAERNRLIAEDKLARYWMKYPRVPYNYILTWEEPKIQGGSYSAKPRKYFKEE